MGITLMVGHPPGHGVRRAGRRGDLRAVALSLSRSGDGVPPAVAEAVAGATIAAGLLVAVYPHVFAHPGLLVQSAQQSASFRDSEGTGYLYVPFHLATQFPLFLQGLFAIGLWAAVTFIVAHFRVDPVGSTRLALVVVQVAALPLVALAKDSDLYNGLRQLLFASPAWAVLVTSGWSRPAGVGTDACPDRARRRPRHRRAPGTDGRPGHALPLPVQLLQRRARRRPAPTSRPTTGAPASRSCCPPSRPTARSCAGRPARRGSEHPRAATRPTASTRPRWQPVASPPTAASTAGPTRSGPCPPPGQARACRTTTQLPHDEFYVVIDRDHAVPSNCAQLASVTRFRHWREISMTYVARCRLTSRPLDGTIAFTHPDGENMSPALWAYAPEGWVMRDSVERRSTPPPASASLAFRAPAGCARSGCRSCWTRTPRPSWRRRVNDVPAEVAVAPGTVAVPLPPGVADAWVTFTEHSGAPLGLRVRSMRVVPYRDRLGVDGCPPTSGSWFPRSTRQRTSWSSYHGSSPSSPSST